MSLSSCTLPEIDQTSSFRINDSPSLYGVELAMKLAVSAMITLVF